MKYQEDFFYNHIDNIRQATEEVFEKLLQEERSKTRCFDVDFGSNEDCMLRCVTNSQ